MLVRLVGWLTVAALICLISVTLIARAIDAEIQQRTFIVRDGVTLDCERRVAREGEKVRYEDGSTVVAHAGEVFYLDCHRAP